MPSFTLLGVVYAFHGLGCVNIQGTGTRHRLSHIFQKALPPRVLYQVFMKAISAPEVTCRFGSCSVFFCCAFGFSRLLFSFSRLLFSFFAGRRTEAFSLLPCPADRRFYFGPLSPQIKAGQGILQDSSLLTGRNGDMFGKKIALRSLYTDLTLLAPSYLCVVDFYTS